MKQFKICYSFYFLLLLILFSPKQYIVYKLIICLFVHELGHLLFIWLFKYKYSKIEISIFGIFMELNKNKQIFYKDLIIYLGGIFFNYLFFLITKDGDFKLINLLLIIVNIMPIYPLDGYNILKTIMFKIIPHYFSLILLKTISLIILSLLSIYGILISVDLFIFISLLYLVVINIMSIFNINYLHKSFLLDKYLYKWKYKKKQIRFKGDFKPYFYKYNNIYVILNDNIIEEETILESIFNIAS